ncbi:hypothetical protein ACFQZ4_29985 [Catellatospora coxensis]
MTSSLPDRVPLYRARIAVCLLFGLYGVILGTWTARIPAIKEGLRLSDGALSLGLLAFAAGAIIGMQAAGRLVDRYGTGRLLLPVVLADGALLVSPRSRLTWRSWPAACWPSAPRTGCSTSP